MAENHIYVQGYEIDSGIYLQRDDLARKRVAVFGSNVGTELKRPLKC